MSAKRPTEDWIKSPRDLGESCDDDVLTRRAVAGDPEVFGDLIRCYNQKLLAAATARCNSPEDARDVVQDTYVAALRYLPRFRGEATIRGWLYRLAMSACTKRRRGRKNDPALHMSLSAAPDGDGGRPVDLPAPELEDPERQAVVNEAMNGVGEVLLQLNELDRAVLVLVDGEGHRPSEVAPMLELTESAVKSRLHRARKAIRESRVAELKL